MNLILTETEIVFVSIWSWFETIESLLQLFMTTEHELVLNKPKQTRSYSMNTTVSTAPRTPVTGSVKQVTEFRVYEGHRGTI